MNGIALSAIERVAALSVEIEQLRARVHELERPIRLRIVAETEGLEGMDDSDDYEFEITVGDYAEIRNVRQDGRAMRDRRKVVCVGHQPMLVWLALAVEVGSG